MFIVWLLLLVVAVSYNSVDCQTTAAGTCRDGGLMGQLNSKIDSLLGIVQELKDKQDEMSERLEQCQLAPEPQPEPTEPTIPGCPELTRPSGCPQIYDLCSEPPSGEYTVYVGSEQTPMTVYCDMTTEGGGWTVIQRRKDGSVDFYRNWADYAAGFGDVSGEFWIGNDNLNLLTSGARQVLRVDLADFEDNTRYAEYDNFAVSSADDKYRLTLGAYSGDAGDSMTYHSGYQFSTQDNDNDGKDSNCAVTFKGAWWYQACHYSNLNGQYLTGQHDSYADGVNWKHWLGYHYSLKLSEMKIKPYVEPERPRDCAEVLSLDESRTDGEYTVYAGSDQTPIQVYCDMTTDGGGWTVFQRRKDGSVDFYRNWADYASGFGDVNGNFWLGNDNINLLTSAARQRLRVDLTDFDDNTRYAEYDEFAVAAAGDKYRLSLGAYSGDAGRAHYTANPSLLHRPKRLLFEDDSMTYHSGHQFTTQDNDNDANGSNCAVTYKGAWWYNTCHYSNLNGQYLEGQHDSFADGVNWRTWLGYNYSLKLTEMKMKPF